MKLTRNYKILILALVGAWIILSGYKPPQEAIAILDTTFIIKNQNTGLGVPSAKIECFQHDTFGGIPASASYTIYTDSSGVGVRIIAQGIYTIKITAAGFNVYQTDYLDMRVSGEVNPKRTFTFTLTPGSGGNPPPGTYATTFYLVGPNNIRVIGYISSEGNTQTSDAHGFAQLFLTAGTHNVRINGYYIQSAGTFITFDYTGAITITGASTYTAYVNTASILPGNPPAEGSGGFDFTQIIDWLTSSSLVGWVPNWVLIIGALVLVLLLGR
jgi:hypothetical protein